MNQDILNACNNYLISDYDNDLVGMCKHTVDLLKLLKLKLKDENLPECIPPERFYKLEPHLPRMILRANFREFFVKSIKYEKYKTNNDENQDIKNLIALVYTIAFVYHMPLNEMIKILEDKNEFTRKLAFEMLLKDNMSPNLFQEPSGNEYTHGLL